jgi:short-subunit dehydrogenase
LDLKDRTVVLTGASRGIGVAIARDLASAGCDLVLVARDGKRLADVASALPGRVRIVSADVSTEAGRAAVLAVGDIDVLVNNAGIEIAVALHDQTPEEIEAQFAVNLVAPTLLTRAVLPGMIARKRGAVVMVSSMSGKSPTPYNSVYAATKHGLVGLVSSIRLELHGSGVTAGVVCPSFVADAGMWADTGLRAPGGMREVPLAQVVAGVRKAIDGAGEVLVTPGPIRPLLALAALAPGLSGPVLRMMGVVDTLRARAVVAARRHA